MRLLLTTDFSGDAPRFATTGESRGAIGASFEETERSFGAT
jgi:hypothetical protein